MPHKTQQRTLETEIQMASTIANLRKEKGWTYEELAERMESVGCKIHPSGIQKTEKSGRRITVDEFIGYSRAFEVPIEALIDARMPQPSTKEFWRTLLAAEEFYRLYSYAHRSYREMILDVQKEAAVNAELRDRILERFRGHLAMEEKKAREMAAQDDVDVTTDQKFETYLWDHYATASMFTARDVLKGIGSWPR
ncbi:helix-turn-helix transcriptional regulator [Micrococcaceae bacterium Sec5.7]